MFASEITVAGWGGKLNPGLGQCGSNPSDLFDVEDYEDLPDHVRMTWVFLLKAYRILVEAVDRDVSSESLLSLPDLELLFDIRKAGGRVRFNKLAKLSLLSKSQISRRVASLQERGFVERDATDEDRRAVYAVITGAGLAALTSAQRPFLKSLRHNFFDRIPEQKFGELSGLLAGLIDDAEFFGDGAFTPD